MARARDVTKTRQILVKLLQGKLLKTIAYEENCTEAKVKWAKNKYTREETTLKLNSKGLFLMNEEQLPLIFERTKILRVDHRLNNSRTEDAKIRRRIRGYKDRRS